jgi:hypothetical protein
MPAIGRLGSAFAFAAPSVGSSSPKTCPWQGHARSSIATSHTRIRSSRQLHGSSADDLQLAMVACLGPSFWASTTARARAPRSLSDAALGTGTPSCGGFSYPSRAELGVRFQREPMTPLTPVERDALRLRAAKADEVFSGRTVGELILDVRETRADASAGLLGAALDAILAQCLVEPFEPWPGSLVAALVAP